MATDWSLHLSAESRKITTIMASNGGAQVFNFNGALTLEICGRRNFRMNLREIPNKPVGFLVIVIRIAIRETIRKDRKLIILMSVH